MASLARPHNGPRLNELGQLHVGDVRREDGVWFLAIEPGAEKRVKTRSSPRRIPVHPALVKLGFLGLRPGATQRRSSSLVLRPQALQGPLHHDGVAQRWARHARETAASPIA